MKPLRLDPLTRIERSQRMARIRNTDTKPEMVVRRLVHRMGYRYRLHSKDLPGSPDLVFRQRNKVIFVHGCFWHQHGCRHYRQPRTNLTFWQPKLSKNQSRDASVTEELLELGWNVMIVWECELTKDSDVSSRIKKFLDH